MCTLTALDFISMTDDETRQGALRYSVDAGRTFASPARDQVPSMVELPALVDAARRNANHRETDTDLDLLTLAGTSMGGARPKTTVRTDTGHLAIAKLPSTEDQCNVLAWEATALELARQARVTVPKFELHHLTRDTTVLVANRFDRNGSGAGSATSAGTPWFRRRRTTRSRTRTCLMSSPDTARTPTATVRSCSAA